MRKPKVNNQIAAFNIFTDDIGYSNSFDVVTGPLNHLDLTPALGTAILQLNGQLSLTVQGEDVCHNPISGLEYAWTSTGGTVDPLSGSSTTYTAGTVAGTGFYVRASSGGVSADVGITVNPGPLNHIHLNPESQALQVGGGQAFDAQGEDQYNNPISGLTYTWTATGGTVFPAMGASTTYTAGTVAGTGFYVRAASGGVSTDAAITLGHGPINRVAVDPASFMLKRGEQKNLTAQAFDAYDNLDSDAEFDWLATGGVLDAATGTANKYTAGTTLGSFNVSVTSSGKEGIVPVKVVADDMITIFYDYGSSTSGIMGMYSDGSNFMSPIGLWNSGLGNWDSARSRPMIGDYNGDGRNDIIIFYDYGYENSAVMTMLNTGTTFNLPQMVWISGPGNWDANRSRPMIGDYNGDGRDDVIIFYDYGYSNSAVMTMLNNGSGFDAPQQVWISGPGNWDAARSRPMIGDYNGDTLDDVIIFYDYGYENSAVMTMLNTGTTFNAPQQVWISGPGNWDAARSRPMLGDYDGDTRDDIIIFYDYGNANSAVMTMWNTGTTFNPPLVSWISGPGNWEAGRSVVFTR